MVESLHLFCPNGGKVQIDFPQAEPGQTRWVRHLNRKSSHTEPRRKGPTGTEPEWENFPLQHPVN